MFIFCFGLGSLGTSVWEQFLGVRGLWVNVQHSIFVVWEQKYNGDILIGVKDNHEL